MEREEGKSKRNGMRGKERKGVWGRKEREM